MNVCSPVWGRATRGELQWEVKRRRSGTRTRACAHVRCVACRLHRILKTSWQEFFLGLAVPPFKERRAGWRGAEFMYTISDDDIQARWLLPAPCPSRARWTSFAFLRPRAKREPRCLQLPREERRETQRWRQVPSDCPSRGVFASRTVHAWRGQGSGVEGAQTGPM